MELEEVCRVFGLGKMRDEPVEVAGGLSNEMWRVVTDGGAFAVKRMIVNAERPGFVDAVEASFAVERRAWSAGIPMPEPVPCGRRALARVGGGALVRVQRSWSWTATATSTPRTRSGGATAR
jgi:hypothetical protein